MASFYSGDYVGAVVADVGSYATKVGYAGEDYPRSYFRSNVAVLRKEEEVEEAAVAEGSASAAEEEGNNNNNGDKMEVDGDGSKDKRKRPPPSPSSPSSGQQRLRPGRRPAAASPIVDVRYDYYNRPIIPQDGVRDRQAAAALGGKGDRLDGRYEVANPVDAATGLWDDFAVSAELLPELVRHGCEGAGVATRQRQPATAGGGGGEGRDPSYLDRHPLMLVERSYNPPPIRQRLAEMVFEEMGSPAAFLAKDASLMCYGCGRVTGTVVDVGYSGTTVTPVYEGYVEGKGIRRSPAGVRQMDEQILRTLDKLQNINQSKSKKKQYEVRPLYQVRMLNNPKVRLRKRKDPFHHLARLQIALECREAGSGAEIDTNPGFQAPSKFFELPDGTRVNIPSGDRFGAADLIYGGADSQASIKRREELLEAARKKVNSIADEAEDDENDDGGGGDDDEQYSEEAAVGISKKKAKRGEGDDTKSSGGKAKSKSSSSSGGGGGGAYNALHRACGPYLRSHAEQHLTSSPVASMVCDAAYRCDRDQQAALLGNVVVGGGGSCLGPTDQAVPDLVKEQVESIIHAHTPGWRVKVMTPGIQERSVLAWLGGSVLASMGTFHDMWITKAEYEEWGPAIVNRKCP